jgi:ribonuclease J
MTMAEKIKIIPLGGFDKIGMNMTLIESESSIIAIDCGTSFPPDNIPGVAAMIPDVSYIRENIDRFKGIVLTHGHEDHIGALPYIAGDLKAPVYGTPLTIAMAEKKLRDFGIRGVKTKAIKFGATIVAGDFKIEFIKTNHSIPDSSMLAIYTSQGIILHTGDFKVDMTPVVGQTGDITRLAALGTKGVLAVLSDSTNAMTEGFSKSEYHVYEQLDRFFNMYSNSRLIIVTFATNMDRIQQIINLARKYHRKIALEGKLMLDVLSVARKLGYVDMPEDVLADPEQLSEYDDGEVIFLTTGNHGESVQCISEIAAGSHPRIGIRKNDVVLFSSIAIHGSELEFNRTLNSLEEQGAKVEFQDLHATGHACAEELKLIYTILHPRFVIPAHGEYRYRREAKRIATEVGISPDNVFLIDNGDIVELDSKSCTISGELSLGEILIDGYEKSRIDTSIIQDREQLSESGVVIIEVCTDKKTGRLASGINIECRGFLDEKNFQALAEGLKDSISSEISRFIAQGVNDDRIRKGVEDLAREYISAKSGKNPLVIVLVTKVML